MESFSNVVFIYIIILIVLENLSIQWKCKFEFNKSELSNDSAHHIDGHVLRLN